MSTERKLALDITLKKGRERLGGVGNIDSRGKPR
jgi:hypothetical protein